MNKHTEGEGIDTHDEGRRIPPLPDHFLGAQGGPGKEYVYERGQLLAPESEVERVRELMDELDDVTFRGAEPVGDLEVSRIQFSSQNPEVPDVVDELHGRAPDLWVGPNHVLAHISHASLMARTPPRPATGPTAPNGKAGQPQTGASVGSPDTGAWDHPYFAGRCDFRDPQDLDEQDADGDDMLDYAAGHGTFIAGVVLQHAPGATVVARRLPRGAGASHPSHQYYITDTELALGLADLPELQRVNVLNLSVGGYTHGGMGLLATEAVLHMLLAGNPELVIVAGAGNDGVSDPFFPAAMKRVIAVAALDADGQQRACFSNFGWWVDACAPGVDVLSTFLVWDKSMPTYAPLLPSCVGVIDLPDPALSGFQEWARWDGTSFAAPRVAAAIAERIAAGRSGSEAVRDVIHDPPLRLPGLGTIVT